MSTSAVFTRPATARLLPATVTGLFAALFTGVSPAPADAAPITVRDPNGYLIVVDRANNDLGRAVGRRISIGQTSAVPNGSAGTTATATTMNISTGQTVSYTLPFVGSPAIPNQFGRSIAYDPSLTGPWTLTFRNGPDTRVITTPSLGSAAPPPFATAVTYSGSSANPTFTWQYPAGSIDGVFFDIFDKSIRDAAGGPALVYSKTINGDTGSYSVPTSLAGGLTLQQGRQYTLDIFAVKSRDPSAPLSNANSLGWSESFFNFTPLPDGSPVVNLPAITPSGAYQYSLSMMAGQTYYLDPVVTTGYDFATGLGNPNFASVVLPTIQAAPYALTFTFDGTLFTNQVAPGTIFNFPAGGVSAFSVRGIDPANNISPTDTTAFVTGLTFAGSGIFDGTQTPVTTEIAAVPEPASAALLVSACAALGWAGRRRRDEAVRPTAGFAGAR